MHRLNHFVVLIGCLVLCACLNPLSSAYGAARSGCKPYEFDADELQKRIRRWSELDAFDNWRLVHTQAERCTENDSIFIELIFEPPSFWSALRAPYRFSYDLVLEDSESKPKNISRKLVHTLAKSVHKLILRLEADKDVLRFMERFSIDMITIRFQGEPPGLQATFQAQAATASSADKPPSLMYSDKEEGGVIGYELPRIDSLPVRRELLRCVESLSFHYPSCKPVWIKARLIETQDQPDEDDQPTEAISTHWRFEIELSGKNCPEQFHGVVLQNQQGVYNQTPDSKTTSSP